MSEDEEKSDFQSDPENNDRNNKNNKKIVKITALENENRKIYENDIKISKTVNEQVEYLPKVDFFKEVQKETQIIDAGFNFAPFTRKNDVDLTSDVNLDKLKAKYKTKEIKLQKRDYDVFQEENQDNLFSKTIVTNALDKEEYLKEFNDEKMQDLENEVPKPEIKMKGWGNWTGFGVKEKVVDVQKEQAELAKKIVI